MSATEGFDAMSREQHEQMLNWFMYHLSQEQREELAATLPAAYNAWCGRQIVQVVSVNEPERVWLVSETKLVDGHFIRMKVGTPQPAFTEPVRPQD